MPKTGITGYDLPVLCPGDAEKFRCVIEKATKRFNEYFGREHNICIQTKDWQRDSYSQTEDTSYSLRRECFIDDCDMAVAVFWTGFGVTTNDSGSEINNTMQAMIKSEKQFFIYFLEKPILPSKISPDYMRVREFREHCKKKGLYFEVSDEKELLYNFLEDLMKFFSEKGRRKEELLARDVATKAKIGIFPENLSNIFSYLS